MMHGGVMTRTQIYLHDEEVELLERAQRSNGSVALGVDPTGDPQHLWATLDE